MENLHRVQLDTARQEFNVLHVRVIFVAENVQLYQIIRSLQNLHNYLNNETGNIAVRKVFVQLVVSIFLINAKYTGKMKEKKVSPFFHN